MSGKRELAIPKMSDAEIAEYYLSVHRHALSANPLDELAPVILPQEDYWVNQFLDFAHRRGMQKAINYLESQLGSLSGSSVLDIGCGRGRWVKEYAKRGAHVTGVDISREALDLLAEQMPEHRFLCEDLTQLELPGDAFDIVNSVTVLQHLTYDRQSIVLGSIARSLKNGGYLVLLENVAAFDACNVFPHHTQEWIRMVQAAGLRCRACWGTNFEVLFRGLDRVVRSVRRGRPTGQVDPAGQRMECSWVKSGIKNLIALFSFPLELACHGLPIATPTHSAMIFQR